jgi:hypothetical protein
MEAISNQVPGERRVHTAVFMIRAVIAINFLRFALSFSSRFEGTEGGPGLADRIFALRLGGFRVDGIWLVASTCVIFVATFYFLLNSRENPKSRIDACLCAAWVVAFVIFLARAFLTGVIDFG